MAVNLSDIAAMAGRPLAALVGVALPKSRGFEFARELHEGLQSLADEFGVAIIGGDTNTWDHPLLVLNPANSFGMFCGSSHENEIPQ
jgi:thiamine-monophosphate kinase